MERVSSTEGGELPLRVNDRWQKSRYLTIFLFTAPAAAIVWYVFHGVYESLTASVKAVGEIDASTKIGIALGYVVMIGGTFVLAGIAVWSAVAYLRLLRRD